ncbi:MAG: hypothetical protein JSW06_00875 [Thermoplasmatales archaeon]|nr:MAG: hypothetical protein JSW06_00875 [Thermoplasmatales archaeon]
MRKKIVSIFVSMLLFVTVFSVTGAVNIEKTIYKEPNTSSTDIVWSENFDSYTLGSSMHGQGGWKGWDNDPQWTAYVTDNQSRSSPHSVDIQFPADLVYEFTGISSGIWTFIDWVYVPSDFEGQGYFILLDDYTDGAGQNNHWAVQLRMDSELDIIESEYDSLSLPLIYDQWVEIRVEIDFVTDWLECYYNGEILVEKAWTAGINNNGDGYSVLDAVDLFSKLGTSIYHDDLSLDGEVGDNPVLSCEGDLHFGNVSAGATLEDSFTVENIGGGLLDWEITKEPSWGTWTFNPESGDDLPPGALVTVQVTVVAPKEKADFVSTIIVTNLEDPENTCQIDVSMTTPRSQPYLFLQFLERLIQRFPVLELIFSHILG